MIQTVNINVAALPALRGPGSFMVLSQNENGRQLRFRILGSDLPTGCTATFSGTKPDGNVYSTTGTVSGNFVIVQEDIQMTAVAGIWDAKLEIAKGTENIVTSIIRVTVVRDPVAGDAIPSDSQLDGIVTEVKYYAEHARTDAYGSPLTAPTKAQMTDHTRVYVYTGSEPNMVAGNWYLWDGTAWISGGVYNSVAVQSDSELNDFSTNPVQNKIIKAALDQIEGAIPEIDTTLSVAGKAADGKATGDAIDALKEDLSEVYSGKVIHITSINKLDPDAVTANSNINATTGELSYDTTCKATGKIDVPSGVSGVAFTGKNANGTARVCLPMSRIVFYRSDDTVLSFKSSTSSNAVTAIPEGTAYLRIANQNTYYDSRSPMVEFVASTSDISVSFVEYVIIEEHAHGLTYLDEIQQDILERVGALETTVETLDDIPGQVNDLEAEVNEVMGVDTVISSLATFQRGSIVSTTGAYDSSSYYKYRIATPEKITTTKDYIFTIASGFRLYLFWFDALGGKVEADWFQGEVQVASGSILRMMIARVTEDTTETADVDTFCSKVTYRPVESLKQLGDLTEQVENIDAVIPYGLTWDWWINSNSIDNFGNAYIGYVDTKHYAGLLRRQPDGTMQYKTLEVLNNDDDHNACSSIVLPNGKILAIGAYGHTTNNHIICYRSKQPYSIDEMERYSFNIPQTGNYTYKCCYSQVFEYDGILYNFMRCVCNLSGASDSVGWICLVSSDFGETWTAYKAIVGSDPYITFNYASDDEKILKGIYGKNPSATPDMLRGFTFDMSTQKFYDLSGTEIGHLVALNGGSVADADAAHYEDMTDIIAQGSASVKARLFTVAKTPKADIVFLYAVADDSSMSDFTYYLYDNGTSVEIGKSGTPFGNNHYLSGICFGKDINTLYYSKATTELADGDHELHKVILSNGAISSDEIITEASMCILRPLFLGNGELATVVGHYNDQNNDGTYNSSFTAWELKPLFTHA